MPRDPMDNTLEEMAVDRVAERVAKEEYDQEET